MITNLEQIRAGAALKAVGPTKGKDTSFKRADVAGFPALIIGNGLLAAVSYACEGGEARKGIKAGCDAMAKHLGDKRIGLEVLNGCDDGKDLIRRLTSNGTSLDLQRATTEGLAFFSYLKRYAPRDQ